jgi:hypothetical protein
MNPEYETPDGVLSVIEYTMLSYVQYAEFAIVKFVIV